MYDLYGTLIGNLSNYLYSYILIILLVASGIYFTIRTKFVQFRYLKESFKVVLAPKEDDNSISSFQALMVSTASRVGTGNIAGVSTAICLGGLGAIFWMWLTALLGMATAFVEGTLAQIYKRRSDDGGCYGGPSYYIDQALGKHWLGVLFAVFMILTYMVGFNLVASFNIADAFRAFPVYEMMGSWAAWVIGIVLAVLFFVCISGGGKQIAKITEKLVPIMGVLYIAVALFIIITHLNLLPGVFAQIFAGAFDVKAIFGGFAGSAVMLGIKRGLFSNEAGVGAAACAAGSAGVSHPVKQGLVQVLSVFLDTCVICTATAMLLLCSGVAPDPELAGMAYVQACLNSTLGQFGVIFITISLFLFAFTTLLGNFYYAETGIAYLCGMTPSNAVKWVMRLVGAVVVCLGATMKLGIVWDTADVLMGFMALINVPVIFVLLKPVLKCLADYTAQKKVGKDPVFKAADIDLKEKVDFWQ